MPVPSCVQSLGRWPLLEMVAETITIRVTNGLARWELFWDVEESYAGGPAVQLSYAVQIGGSALTFMLCLLLGLLGVENARITQRVRQRTSELANQRSRFESIFNSGPDMLLMIDLSRQIQTCNPNFLEFFDYSSDEFYGKSGRMLFANDVEFDRVAQLDRDGSDDRHGRG